MGLISQKLYDNKDAKFVPLRYITSEDAQNKGFHIKDEAQPILLENYSKYDMGYTKEKPVPIKPTINFINIKRINITLIKKPYTVKRILKININLSIRTIILMPLLI